MVDWIAIPCVFCFWTDAILVLVLVFSPGSESITEKEGREIGQGIRGGRYFTGRHDDEPMDKDQR